MIGHLIWYDIDKDIGNNLQNEWRLWIMNLEFWILEGFKPSEPRQGCAHAVYHQLWKRRCNMDCTYSYFAPDPEKREKPV